MAQSAALGEVHEIELAHGRVRYREIGAGRPVVFVHGLLVNGDIWRGVAPAVAAAGHRAIVPDWPMGSHELPVPDADLSPPGVAAMIAEFLERLELTDVTIVANDTGGGISQIVMANHPERIGRVVLVACDAFECFLPPVFAPLTTLAKVPGAVWALVQAVRWRALHRLPITFGWVSKRPLPADVVDSYLVPSRRDPAIRNDLRRFLSAINRRHTLAAARRLPAFAKPVLLVWAREDRLFPVSLAERLAATLPDATVELVDDSYTFVSEDQPEALSRLVVSFLGAPATP